MIKNYFLIAWRNLLRNRLYSAINIGGLAIGMAVSFLLLLYVYNEYSFDKFNANSNRLYKIFFNQSSDGTITTGNSSPAPLAVALKKDFPEIDNVARTDFPSDALINYKGRALKMNTMAADESILDMFSFDFIEGNKKKALSDLSSIILTESAAKAIFGNTNPTGKVVQFNDKHPLTVSAVIKDNPQNSSFEFKALISWETMETHRQWVKTSGWGNFSFSTYVMLKRGAALGAIDKKIKHLFGQYSPQNKSMSFFLYPYTSLHLYGEFKNGIYIGGNIEHVRLFFFLAIGILLIASINFMNLSTARSERRAREVGVRKAIGARRFALMQQFMSESVLMTFLAFALSVLLMVLSLPLFNDIVGLHLQLPFNNTYAWGAAVGVTLLTGLVAGSYPALFLSSFNPVKVLKNQFGVGKSSVTPRYVLVVVQFTFTISLILSSIFIYKQINEIKGRPVGYNQKNMIEMPLEGNLISKFKNFRQDALNAGAIVDGATTSGSIVNINGNTWGVTWPGQRPEEKTIPIDQMAVSHHFINTYGLTLTKGRDFAVGMPLDSSGVILNEAAVELMRLKEPLGKLIGWQDKQRPVIGVVKNFVWGSPYEPVKPAIVGFMSDWKDNVALRLNPEISVSKSLNILQGLYKAYNPNYPFEYKFIDERFGNKFKTEKLLSSMSAAFTCLAIIVSCLGMFGLALFSAEQRRKEIGIRKVLGAKTAQLWLKLSQEFVKLVLISFVIGAAISWYNIDKWLNNYTYHTSISLWVFVATMAASVGLCLLTVSWQAIRAAWANPVKSLRSE